MALQVIHLGKNFKKVGFLKGGSMKRLIYFSIGLILLSGCGAGASGDLTGVLGRPDWYQNDPFGTVYIPAGSYTVKATLKYLNVNPLAPVTRLKVTAVNSPSAVSPNVTGSWVTYTFPLTVVSPGATSIVLQPENNSTLNDGNYVSWIQIDNICIERVPDPCDCINYPQKPAITGTTLACACDPIKFF